MNSARLDEDVSRVVSVRNLAKTYGSRTLWGARTRIEALRGVSLDAHAGEVFGLLGPNGAGKTTLIKTLLGVIKPTSGTASLFGQPIGTAEARKRVGYLPESLRVDRHHTARSALRFYGRLSQMDSASIRRKSDELLDLVGLKGRDNESVKRFSKGMYQRLGLAQALMHDPDLLVLDEPTDGLDPVGRNEVRKVIDRLRDLGKTIFLNSHILQEVELVCTRVAIMAKGQILALGPIDTLRSHDAKHSRVMFEVLARNPHIVGSDNAGSVEREATLRSCFSRVDPSIVTLERRQDQYQVALNPTAQHSLEQADLDAMIDRLRQSDFSITHFATFRPTLEDTFMQLVGQETEATSNLS